MGVSLLLRTLHRDSHFRTNFRVLERRGDSNWEVSASLGHDQHSVFWPFRWFFNLPTPEEDFVIRNGVKDLERRLPLPRIIGEYL